MTKKRRRHNYSPGEIVEIRYLPGEKSWERATYVRRVRRDEMPVWWRGVPGHVVEFRRPGDKRQVQISAHRIRKYGRSEESGSVLEVGAHVRVSDALAGWGGALDRYGVVERVSLGELKALVRTEINSGWVQVEHLTRVGEEK